MKKAVRQLVYAKYNGLCAYTGKPLDEMWQVDHVIPKCMTIQRDNGVQQHDDIENLLPACRIVNHYKRSLDLDQFRWYMSYFHKRLAKLPKNPIVKRSINRKIYMQEIAELFDITPEKPFSGTFYFETINKTIQ